VGVYRRAAIAVEGKTAPLAGVAAAASAQQMRVGTGVAARIEGDWPYAPVLEALADLCRHHPTLLDGLDDAFRDEIERALSGRQFRWDGQGAHQRQFVAAAELLRLAAAISPISATTGGCSGSGGTGSWSRTCP
jgi:hypothetical protein